MTIFLRELLAEKAIAVSALLICLPALVFAQPDTLWTRVDPDGAGGESSFIRTNEGHLGEVNPFSPRLFAFWYKRIEGTNLSDKLTW